MRFEVYAMVADEPDRVWAWWTDYGEPGHEETVGHGLGWSRRRVVAREGNTITLRESLLGIPLLRHQVELDPARKAFRETSDAYESWWTFERAPGGTRIRREVETLTSAGQLAPKGLTRWAAQRDLRHHVHEYERSHLG